MAVIRCQTSCVLTEQVQLSLLVSEEDPTSHKPAGQSRPVVCTGWSKRPTFPRGQTGVLTQTGGNRLPPKFYIR
jgi:hypothetical protein